MSTALSDALWSGQREARLHAGQCITCGRDNRLGEVSTVRGPKRIGNGRERCDRCEGRLREANKEEAKYLRLVFTDSTGKVIDQRWKRGRKARPLEWALFRQFQLVRQEGRRPVAVYRERGRG